MASTGVASINAILSPGYTLGATLSCCSNTMNPPPENPLRYFENWFFEAENHDAIEEANAMNLCTCTCDGLPSSRMVLLKEYNENGFSFYTNLGSRKAQQLDENPLAALCFYWEPLGRQVRIEGKV